MLSFEKKYIYMVGEGSRNGGDNTDTAIRRPDCATR